jgi:hypothetical protein
MKLLLSFAALATAYAGCPNGCSGHGSCGTSDVCACYKGFFGGDCSFRYCPVGPSFTVTPKEDLMDDRKSEFITLRTPGGWVGRTKFDTNGATYPIQAGDIESTFEALYPRRPSFNQYAECSSRGTCDYATGQCKCFEGFEGRGCRRTSCPNDCSGHGRCLQNSLVNPDYTSVNYNNDQMWDQERTQSCSCDRGFTGYDCASRICPFGDDPTSDCGENSAGDVQLVVVQSLKARTSALSPLGPDIGQYFTLTFTDMFGGEYTTRPILDRGRGTVGNPIPEIQYALMDLPNFAIPEVEVDWISSTDGPGVDGVAGGGNAADDTTTSLYTVQFTDPSNAGKQNTMACNTVDDPNVAGAQPKYVKAAMCKVFNVGGPEWFTNAGESIKLDLTAHGFDGAPTNLDLKTVLGDVAFASITAGTTYEDFQPCSSKGDCDGSTGTCTCNSGHFGEACEEQSTYY